MSTCDYGSRKGYSIETALLEKRLMYDVRACNNENTVHNMSDLEACYDRQLPRIGGIAQEMLGVEHEPLKIFETILPIMEHYILTGYGISNESHGSV